MSDHIYKKIEITGSSTESMEDAVNNAINRAAKSVRNMRWFEIVETRGHIEDQKLAEPGCPYMTPWAWMAWATRRNPPTFAPAA